jgi:hypothetical protein
VADVCVVVRYRKALTYGVHALLAAELADPGARIHAHAFMPLPGTPWRDASPAFIPVATLTELDRLAQQGASYGHWRKQAEHSARLAETARAYPRRTRRRRTDG